MVKKEIKQEGLEFLYNDGELYSIIVRDSFRNDSIAFFTPDDFSQQLGYLPHKKGNVVAPHTHKLNRREVLHTQEVLFVKKGKVKINFYNPGKEYIHSEILCSGEVILLCGGGHGLEILEDAVMIEVKQGPFVGVEDKERFEGIEGCR